MGQAKQASLACFVGGPAGVDVNDLLLGKEDDDDGGESDGNSGGDSDVSWEFTERLFMVQMTATAMMP